MEAVGGMLVSLGVIFLAALPLGQRGLDINLPLETQSSAQASTDSSQVWLLNRSGGEAKRLTEMEGGVSGYVQAGRATSLSRIRVTMPLIRISGALTMS